MKKVSIVIPVFNEEKTIERLIKAVAVAPVLGLEKEIIIVDDGSTDGTREILQNFDTQHKIILCQVNQGKGAVLKIGLSQVTGEVIIIQDADLEYSPSEYPILLEPIVQDKADVVFGSRFLGGRPHRVLYFWHYVGNRFLTILSNIFTNLNLSDMETCYKVFTKDVLDKILPKLESKRFGFEPEITARLAKLSKKNQCRIFEVGISYFGRTYAEAKKIGWKDGFEATWCIIKYNLQN